MFDEAWDGPYTGTQSTSGVGALKGNQAQRRPGRPIERGAGPSAEALTGFVTCL
jgi:hypothetical protein